MQSLSVYRLILPLASAVVLLAGCAPGTGGQPTPAEAFPALDSGTLREAHALTDSVRRATGSPGLAVAVAVDGQLVWSEGFGWADAERRIPAEPTTRFRIGSVSKLLTAATAALLWQEGKLDLDAPVQRYVSEFPAAEPPITARHLLGHLAGIRHYGRDDYINRTAYEGVRESLVVFAGDSLRSPPGARYFYSSYGYNLLGAVLEAAAEQEFRSLVRESILAPLGMGRTVAEEADMGATEHATPYSRAQDGSLSPAPFIDLSDRWPSGGYLSTAEDLARFGAALLRGGLLEEEARGLMTTSQRTRDGEETGVGWGWRIGTDSAGRRILHHGGSSMGGRAFLLAYPERGLVVALLANLSFAEFGEREAKALAELFLEQGRRASLLVDTVALREAVPSLLAAHRVPGLALAVVRDGSVAWSAGFGEAAGGAPVVDRTVFEAASLSKPVFAVMVLRLAAEGILDLDEPMGRWVPGLDRVDSRLASVTARQILSHTAGFPPSWRGGELRLDEDPGLGWRYSGAGYVFLQHALERVTGQPLDRLARRLVFAPLEMERSAFGWRDHFASAAAAPHDSTGAPLSPVRYGDAHVARAGAASTLYTTAADYARFLAAVSTLRDDPQLAEMFVPVVGVDRELGLEWALGWAIQRDHHGGPWAFHWGANPHFRSFTMLRPTTGDAWVAFANAPTGLELMDELSVLLTGSAPPLFSFYMMHPTD